MVVGDGIFSKSSCVELIWRGAANTTTNYYQNAVRGTFLNDIFVAGAYGELLHFNGTTWRSFHSQAGLSYGQYYSVAVKGRVICAAGVDHQRGIVLRGLTQNQ